MASVLLLLLIVHTVYGRESIQLPSGGFIPGARFRGYPPFLMNSSNAPVFRSVTLCPKMGHFSIRERDEIRGGYQCYLCFCNVGDFEAVCWKHPSYFCNFQMFEPDEKVRSRRSPGFADLFFQDAAREIFKKQTPEECKPFQSSRSVGCPPADWCIGCTVCDCNAHGRWDCHVLSFCPGGETHFDNDNPKIKTRKGGKEKELSSIQ